METNTENANSQISVPQADLETLDAAALKEMYLTANKKLTEVESTNKQLFARAKKAEGFELQEDGSWVKTVEKPKPGRPKEKTEEPESGELDFGTKAFLLTQEIKADEFGWVKEQMEESGIRDVEKLLANPYFKSTLQARRDQQSAEAAAPGNTRTTGENPKTKVDYWVAKGELPENTPENQQLRRDVLNKRLEVESGKGRFSNTPIIHS